MAAPTGVQEACSGGGKIWGIIPIPRLWHIPSLNRVLLASLVLACGVEARWIASLPSTLHTHMQIARLSSEDAQARVNGSIAAYAARLPAILPVDSCLVFLHTNVRAMQTARREYTFPNVFVLAHELYPRRVLLATDVEETIRATGCSASQVFTLIWIEPEYATTATSLADEVLAVYASGRATEVLIYRDDDGHMGYLFEIAQVGAE